MEKTLGALQKEDVGERALTILQPISYFGADDIHTGMFESLVENTNDLKLVIDALKRHKFVECFDNGTVIRIDSSTQARLRTYFKEQNNEEKSLCLAVKLLTLSQESASHFNHVVSVFEYSREYPGNVPLVEELSIMGGQVILGLIKTKRYAEGRKFGYDVLDFAKRVLGKQHLKILKIQQNIGTLLEAEGRFEEAADLLLSLFKIDEAFCSLNDVPLTLVKIAKSLSVASPAEILPNYDSILKGSFLYYVDDERVKTYYHEHVQTMCEMDLTEKSLQILSRYLKKIRNPSRFRTRAVTEKILDHKDLVMYTMGHLFLENRDTVKALETFNFIYKTRSLDFGEMHPNTLLTKRIIAAILMMQGQYDEAFIILHHVAERLDLVLGELHPESLDTRNFLARSLANHWKDYEEDFYDFGRLKDAYDMLTDVYEKLRLLRGEFNIETLKIKHKIGEVLGEQDKEIAALKVLREVLEGYRKVLGPNHKDTLKLMDSIDSQTEYIRDKVAYLIESEEDINAQDAEGYYLLHYATEFSMVEHVQLLLKKGAAYDAKNMEKKTPLQLTDGEELKELFSSAKTLFVNVKAGNPEQIREFHSTMKWIVNVKDSTGHTPLHWATFKGHQHILLLLLELGADATSVSNKNNSTLHVAVSKGQKEIVQTLLQFVVSDHMSDFINGRTEVGGTSPLHVAAERGFLDIVKILLRRGAAYDIRNRVGKTPLELAKDGNVRNLLGLVDSFFTCARNGNADMVEKLKDVDQDDLLVIKNTRDSRNHTLLETAVQKYHQVVENLQEILKSDTQN